MVWTSPSQKEVSRRAFRVTYSMNLIALSHADQIVLSHDVFLKQMWAKNGGNGRGFVPNVFLAYLAARGVDNDTRKAWY
ncbi:hypothetical protein KCP78_17450 [Salmonella enterica subsp. enterica]|nr:hypothetical protein KCP78_17450 [Salmonella enterica subsp. enterica]